MNRVRVPGQAPASPEVRSLWHSTPSEQAIQQLATDVLVGLTADEVRNRSQQFGGNVLEEAPPVPLWKRLLSQFHNLVIWILIAAAVISGVLKEWADTLSILAIVLLNGILGFVQEERAERALAALQKLSSPMARVRRDGTLQLLPASELVPGDCIELEAGDNIPADARLLTAFGFQTQEAALTGESLPNDKEAACVLNEDASLGDRRNMVYMGTVASSGRATAVVVATGMRTELGRIAGLLQRSERELTPLQRRLEELGRVLVGVCLGIVAFIFLLQLWRGGPPLEMLMVSVSLAVAAVPEGLPAVITLTLALGLQRMVKRNALVRKLPSVETLGSVTVICSDKTGTLTRNEMTVREVVTASARFHVTGAGYVPHGQFLKRPLAEQVGQAGNGEAIRPAEEPELIQLLTTSARCNHSAISPRGDGIEAWQVVGDPTEGALLVAALKAGVAVHGAKQHTLFEIPFDSERKAMSIVVREAPDRVVMHTKGAPEAILPLCISERHGTEVVNLTEARREQIMRASMELAALSLRVLALAYREHLTTLEDEFREEDLILAGLVGMIDPPREDVREAVQLCLQAGIRPVMITGDHPETALAIAQELHIAGPLDRVVSGQMLDSWSDEALTAEVGSISVYARVTAEHKLRVVRALKAGGQIVAMTGDGVNDAPAVRAADIGIAMGVTGTDVTKEASDMVLMDDNFTSIVSAVEEGRGIFDNIQKVVHFLLSCNTGEVLLMFVAALLGWPVPLMAIQILWINLVTDGLPALALGMEPPERDIMQRPPRPPEEPVLTRQRGLLILFHGMLIASAAAIGFWLVYRGDPAQLARARTVAFSVMAFSQLFYAIGCRSPRYTMPQIGLLSNPFLLGAIAISVLLQLSVMTLPWAQPVFEVATHLTWEWVPLALLSLAPVTVIEIVKLVRERLRPT